MKLKLKRPNTRDVAKTLLSSENKSKNATSQPFIVVHILFLLNAIICSNVLILSHCHPQEKSILSNEIPHNQLNNNLANQSEQQPSRDVTNLKLIADFRAIKLHWTYDQPNRPSVFRVRYCELTSWNAEIKCRQKELPVVEQRQADEQKLDQFSASAAAAAAQNNDTKNLSVIQTNDNFVDKINSIHVIDRVNYETNVHDLRALTNYTFQVQVARFLNGGHVADQRHQHSTSAATSTPGQPHHRTASMGRRLDDSDRNNNDLVLANQVVVSAPVRIETKPFGAEAARCLANSSEVLIFTGRHFGGRISVEGQADSRCQLLGNRSSEQSVYLFRIDHQVCHSKLLDGNRIETMLLVHENKDILTHNTARFLVQCNFNHKSFTVKASVSLPKIDSLAPNLANDNSKLAATAHQHQHQHQHRRPATITRIKTAHQGHEQVRIGSMPGIYRPSSPRRAADPLHRQQAASSSPPEHAPTNHYDPSYATTAATTPLNSGNNDDNNTSNDTTQHHLNTISSGQHPLDTTAAPLAKEQRQSKQLLQTPARSLVGQLKLPDPVDVSSGSLQVERAIDNMLRESRSFPLTQALAPPPDDNLRRPAEVVAANFAPFVGLSRLEVEAGERKNLEFHKMTAATTSGAKHSAPLEPIVTMTNNHRVAGDFMPLSQVGASTNLQSVVDVTPQQQQQQQQQQQLDGNFKMHQNAATQMVHNSTREAIQQHEQLGNFTIKYSPAEVSEYSLDKLDSLDSGHLLQSRVHHHRDHNLHQSHHSQLVHRPLVVAINKPITSARQRSGRMRVMQAPNDQLDGGPTSARFQVMQQSLESRMGDRVLEGRQLHNQEANDLAFAESQRQLDRQKPKTAIANGTIDTNNHPKIATNELVEIGHRRQLDNDADDHQSGDASTQSSSPSSSDLVEVGPQLQPTIGQSLVQNITGALLRLSLKTLGNLARKSLESFAIESNDDDDDDDDGDQSKHIQTTNGTTTTTTANKSTGISEQQVLVRSTPTGQPVLATALQAAGGQLAQKQTPNNFILPPPESTKPMSTSTSKSLLVNSTPKAQHHRSSEHELDGFIVQKTETTPKANATTTIRAPEKAHKTQLVPISRQLAESHAGHQNHDLTSLSPPQGLNSSALSATATKSDKTNQRSLYDWIGLYGIWTLVGLGFISIVIIYLNFNQLKNYNDRQHRQTLACNENTLSHIFGSISPPNPHLTSGGQSSKCTMTNGDGGGSSGAMAPPPVHRLSNDASYLANHQAARPTIGGDADDDDDDGTLTVSRQSLLSSSDNKQHEQLSGGKKPHQAAGSLAARGASSTLGSIASSQRENYCNTNELVYTDHVIFNSLVARHNESFA